MRKAIIYPLDWSKPAAYAWAWNWHHLLNYPGRYEIRRIQGRAFLAKIRLLKEHGLDPLCWDMATSDKAYEKDSPFYGNVALVIYERGLPS